MKLGENFWNFRGSFKVAGLDIGTHASLVKLQSGDFVLLDCYSFSAKQQREIEQLTDGGERLSAVINLHPFHTVHCEEIFRRFPNAAHYGTQRHHEKLSHLSWESQRSEEFAQHNPFLGDLEFTVPQGVDFISANESIHFSSILAIHDRSKTLHVDDTLMLTKAPGPLAPALGKLGLSGLIQFHPTLPLALERRAGAVDAFQDWIDELLQLTDSVKTLCAAHKGVISAERGLASRIRLARRLATPILVQHRLRFG